MKYNYVLSSSLTQLPKLRESLEKLKEKRLKHILFAIWHGRRRTDAFLLDSDKVLNYVRER